MQAVVRKWGNSLALRIPKAVAQAAGWRLGQIVSMTFQDDKIVIEPGLTPQYSLAALLKGVNKKNIHDEIGTSTPVGKEERSF